MDERKNNAVRVAENVVGGRKKQKKTRDKALNQKRKIINLKFKINTKFYNFKIHTEFLVKIIKILKY